LSTTQSLALKIATTTIQSLFGGDISREGTVVWRYLECSRRFIALEKQVMYFWQKIRCVTLPVARNIAPTVSYRQLLEALESLQQRSLIERDHGTFTQLPVIMVHN